MARYYSEVIDAVMGLPEAQRSTILLVYVEGFSYVEAAEILGIPTGTVMSRLSVARKRLASLKLASQSQSGDTQGILAPRQSASPRSEFGCCGLNGDAGIRKGDRS